MSADQFQRAFEAGIPSLQKRLLSAFKSFDNKGGYKVVWEEFEDRMFEVLKDFLLETVPGLQGHNIIQTQTKSSYPDFKILYEGHLYAIDIKSGADDKADPWYDMGRLDTFEENHTQKYQAEYYITVKYSRDPGKDGAIIVRSIYVEPFYKSVGFRGECEGVLYRPYDGKLRPKTWADFESGKTYWSSREQFLGGLQRSRRHRRMKLIKEWIKEMSPEEKRLLQTFLAGQASM
jgi:hypothetical protein